MLKVLSRTSFLGPVPIISFHLFSENDLSQPVDDINLSAEIKILGKFEGERGLSITFRDFQDPFNSENKEDFPKRR